MYQILQIWNHPEDLYAEGEDCYEVAGDWETKYKLQRKGGNCKRMRLCAKSRINYSVTCADSSNS